MLLNQLYVSEKQAGGQFYCHDPSKEGVQLNARAIYIFGPTPTEFCCGFRQWFRCEYQSKTLLYKVPITHKRRIVRP